MCCARVQPNTKPSMARVAPSTLHQTYAYGHTVTPPRGESPPLACLRSPVGYRSGGKGVEGDGVSSSPRGGIFAGSDERGTLQRAAWRCHIRKCNPLRPSSTIDHGHTVVVGGGAVSNERGALQRVAWRFRSTTASHHCNLT